MADWPHAPVHRLSEAGAYIATSGTYLKRHFFRTPERLRLVHDLLLELALKYGWELQAWAVFSNHCHVVASSPADASTLRTMLSELHTRTAISVNEMDSTPGRQVWYDYWDTHLTFPRSYFARLNYVHQNPVKHGVVKAAEDYPWCSARWFEARAPEPFKRTVRSFKIDRVSVPDDF
jgi:putative transposase